jgi:hypothetical protein
MTGPYPTWRLPGPLESPWQVRGSLHALRSGPSAELTNRLVCDVSPASSPLARRPIALNAGSCAVRKWFHLRQWHHLSSRPSPSSRVKSHSSASLPRRLGARGTRTSSLATPSQSSTTRIVFSPSPQSPRSTGRPRWRLRPLPSPAQYILEGPRAVANGTIRTHAKKVLFARGI